LQNGFANRFADKRATLKTYNFFAAEQAFLPVHDKGQTEMSDPPDIINHNGRSLKTICKIVLRKIGKTQIVTVERINPADRKLSFPGFPAPPLSQVWKRFIRSVKMPIL